jgi:hypothetical protein
MLKSLWHQASVTRMKMEVRALKLKMNGKGYWDPLKLMELSMVIEPQKMCLERVGIENDPK